MRRGLGEDDVGVGSAEAEGIHPNGAGQVAIVGKILELHGHAEAAGLEVDVRTRLLEVEAGRDLAAIGHQSRFHQAGHARCRFEVAEIGFHRTDDQRAIRRALRAKGLGQGVRLDGVAHRGARAVRLDITDIGRVDAGDDAGFFDQPRLSLLPGQRNAVGVTVLVCRRGADHRVDRITVGDGLGERLQNHHARPLPAHKTVGRSIEGFAASLRRKHAGPRESDESIGRDHHGHAASQRDRAMSGRKLLASNVHGRERGGTGRIHGDARTGEVEAIGNAVGRDAVRMAGRRMRADARAVATTALDSLVVVVRDADENADIRPLAQIKHEPGVFHRLPGRLEEKTLLRIDVGGFAGRDAEKLRIELVETVDEAAALGDRFAGQALLGIVKTLDVPAVRRNFCHRLPALANELPEIFWVVETAWEAASHADDGDFFLPGQCGRGFSHTRNQSGRLQAGEHFPPEERRGQAALSRRRDPLRMLGPWEDNGCWPNARLPRSANRRRQVNSSAKSPSRRATAGRIRRPTRGWPRRWKRRAKRACRRTPSNGPSPKARARAATKHRSSTSLSKATRRIRCRSLSKRSPTTPTAPRRRSASFSKKANSVPRAATSSFSTMSAWSRRTPRRAARTSRKLRSKRARMKWNPSPTSRTTTFPRGQPARVSSPTAPTRTECRSGSRRTDGPW